MLIKGSVQIGELKMNLVERPSSMGHCFASRFYFCCHHRDAPDVTAMCFLGHDKSHAWRQYERRVDNALAKRAAEICSQ